MIRTLVSSLRRIRPFPISRAFSAEKQGPDAPKNSAPEEEEIDEEELEELFNPAVMEDDKISGHTTNNKLPDPRRVFYGDYLGDGQPIDFSKFRLKVPDVVLKLVKFSPVNKTYEIVDVKAEQYFSNLRAVILGFIGCFVPECSSEFLYDWAKASKPFKGQLGFHEVVASSINDPFVMRRFAERLDFEDRITFLADWNGVWTQFLESEISEEDSIEPMGQRGTRFSGVLMNNEVKLVNRGAATNILYTSAVSPNALWRYCRHKKSMVRVFL